MITRQDTARWRTPGGKPMMVANISTIDAEKYLGAGNHFFSIGWVQGRVRIHRYYDEGMLPACQSFPLPDTLEELEHLIRMACAMMGEGP